MGFADRTDPEPDSEPEPSSIEDPEPPPSSSARQLRLLPTPRPLDARLGREFFRSLPQQPGVYVMRDARRRPLYVGQSGSLRDRLDQYRRITAETSPSRLVRLVHETETIEWEVTDSPAAARAREKSLILELRPRYNVADTRPALFCAVQFQATAAEWTFHWRGPELEPHQVAGFGPYPPSARHGFTALLRVISAVARQDVDPVSLPRHLLPPAAPALCTVAAPVQHPILAWLLIGFLKGDNAALLYELEPWLVQQATRNPFWTRFWEQDRLAIRYLFLRAIPTTRH